MAYKTVFLPHYVFPTDLLGQDVELHFVNLNGCRRVEVVHISPDGADVMVQDGEFWAFTIWQSDWTGGEKVITFWKLSQDPRGFNMYVSTFKDIRSFYPFMPVQLYGNILEVLQEKEVTHGE